MSAAGLPCPGCQFARPSGALFCPQCGMADLPDDVDAADVLTLAANVAAGDAVALARARRWLATPAALPSPPPVAMETERVAAIPDARARNTAARKLLARYVEHAEAIAPPAPLSECWDTPPPEAILWRDGEPDSVVMAVGEPALLAGAGGLGKSSLCVLLAVAAAAGKGSACGFGIPPGPVVILSYEESRARIAARVRWCAGREVAERIFAVSPAPLWEPGTDRSGQLTRPGPGWARLWNTVGRVGASLVIVDPVSAALPDVSTTQTGPVRGLMSALAAASEATGAGVLLVAHDTKAARNLVREGGQPGAGAVAGSAAWHDAARGVMYMRQDVQHDAKVVTIEKCNHGRAGWGVVLAERYGPGGEYRGLNPEPRAVLTRERLDAHRRDAKKQPANPAAAAKRVAVTLQS